MSGMLDIDMSIDPEDVRDELRNELIVLNADLKKLDRDLDYSEFIRTFLAGEGPAEAQIPRMKKQILRMQKVKDEYLEKEKAKPAPARAASGHHFAAPAASAGVAVSQRAYPYPSQSQTPTIIPTEVLPVWGPLKRYSKMDRKTYDRVVVVCEWMFNTMVSHPDGPGACTVRYLRALQDLPHNIPWSKISAYITNFYLHIENIKEAARAGDFHLVHVGYLRNEALQAQKAANCPGRQNFIRWAVAELRGLPSLSVKDLLCRWRDLPEETRRRIDKKSVDGYFKWNFGVRLTIEELQAMALAEDSEGQSSDCNGGGAGTIAAGGGATARAGGPAGGRARRAKGQKSGRHADPSDSPGDFSDAQDAAEWETGGRAGGRAG